MPSLKTEYLGLKLKNPVIAGSSDLTAHLPTLEKLEEAGVGAVVIKSLFEEEVHLKSLKQEAELHKNINLNAEFQSTFPQIRYSGPKEHMFWVKKSVETLSIPVIASLHAILEESWIDYAQRLEDLGVRAIELNLHTAPYNWDKSGSEIEKEQIELLQKLRKKTALPLSVKITPFYSNLFHFLKEVDQIGLEGIVLFNKPFFEDINIDTEENRFTPVYNKSQDIRLPLYFTGLVSGSLKTPLCAAQGIQRSSDIIKLLLVGAACVQVTSVIYQKGIVFLPELIQGISAWMDDKGYGKIGDFRGKLNRENNQDSLSFSRSQYIKMLMQSSDDLMSQLLI
ncbi:MAG: dihydroorotate dehydrogenase-like protein [Spirochaetales bacterium]|nr:dihydroorotate dehydrogenase-like protein [Spirochaetales bacterium]